MPRIGNIKERQHQPIYDTLVRGYGSSTLSVATRTTLFSNTNIGTLSLTNLNVAGQLAADQTYVALALRCWLYFDGTNRRAGYQLTVSQLYWTFILGEKPQFQGPCWYFPAGGGVWGFDSGTSTFNHGTPSQDAILKLAKPIVIPARQNISVIGEFFKVGTKDALDYYNRTGTISGNASDETVVMFMVDGVRTRDVQ
jgi:hypothetical protein